MAQLYFKYGAMGSSKTANALMARFNYEERGQKTLLVKPRLDQRDGDHMVHSRIGLEYPCIYFDEMLALSAEALQENACIIVDEAQFLSKEEVDYLVHIVDDLGVPVICYGLRADFKGELFPGSYELLVMADKLDEVKTDDLQPLPPALRRGASAGQGGGCVRHAGVAGGGQGYASPMGGAVPCRASRRGSRVFLRLQSPV